MMTSPRTLLLILSFVTLAGSAAAELSLPAGWVAGAATQPEEKAATPACCGLGRGHPCCVRQKRFDKSQPHHVEQILKVDVDSLPVVEISGCAATSGEKVDLPPAEQAADEVGLRIYAEGEGKGANLLRLSRNDNVRMVPIGIAGAIDARNAGVWSAGQREPYFRSSRSFARGYGARYWYGAPWKRVDGLTFDSVNAAEGDISYRYFDGSYDKVTGRVGARCSYEARLAPLLEEWAYGFVAEREGRRELHVLMPDGDSVLASSGPQVAFGTAYRHQILPLDESSAVAVRAEPFATDRWRHLEQPMTDVNYRGVLSVHVMRLSKAERPTVLIAKERSRNRHL
jgi:hypothetical protein